MSIEPTGPASPSPALAERHPFLATRDAFESFVETWKAGRLRKEQWTHAAHVAMGASASVRYGAQALDHMRVGIKRHNDAVGTANTETSGYHETLTRFWLGVISRATAGAGDGWLAAVDAVERFGEERHLHRLYYSFDVVRNSEARAAWVPPDLTGPY